MELTKIQFEDGQKVSDAYVEINGVKHNVVKAQYQGKTPLSARNLNKLQDNVGNAISDLDERVVSYRNVLVDEQVLIKECGGLKLKKLNKLEGKTEQETREGYNKFDLNSDVIAVAGSNLEVITNGIRVTSTSANTNTNATLRILDLTNFAGKTLTLIANLKSSSTNKGIIVLRQNNYDYTGTRSNEKFDDEQATSNGTYKLTYTVADTITDDNRYLFCSLYSRRNAEGTSGEYIDYTNIMIYEGTEDKPYEAYGKTPTPDFPSEVKTVTGNVKIGIYNNNLVDFSNAITTTKADYTFKNDILTVFSTNKTDKNYNCIEYGIDVDYLKNNKGKTLYFNYDSLDLSKYTATDNWIVSLRIAVNGEIKSFPTLSKAGEITPVKIPNDGEITSAKMLVFCNNTSKTGVDSTVSIIKPMLCIDIEKTDYVEHQSGNYPLTLGDIELCKIGDYADYIYKADGKWFKRSYIGKKIFDGTETIGKSSNTSADIFSYTSGITDTSGTSETKCNYLVYKNTNDIGSCRKHNNFIYLIPYAYGTATIEEFKTTLATLYANGNPYIVYYILATPTDTEITDTTLIAQLNALENAQLYEGITNISITGDNLTPILDIDYWPWFKGETGDVSDLQRQIDELRSMIENLNN